MEEQVSAVAAQVGLHIGSEAEGTIFKTVVTYNKASRMAQE